MDTLTPDVRQRVKLINDKAGKPGTAQTLQQAWRQLGRMRARDAVMSLLNDDAKAVLGLAA